MTEYRATCPVHGEVEAAAMDGGWFCMRDDADRPEGICGRPCADPVHESLGPLDQVGKDPPARETPRTSYPKRMGRPPKGAVKEEDFAMAREQRHRKKTCEQCGGKVGPKVHSRSKRCQVCLDATPPDRWKKLKKRHGLEGAREMAAADRGVEPDQTSGFPSRSEGRKTGSPVATGAPDAPPVAPEASRDTSAAEAPDGAKEAPLLARVAQLEQLALTGSDPGLRDELAMVRRRLERLEETIFGETG